jgi:epoxyqueuosine reductase
MGSYFFIAELIVDLELEPDPPISDYCGSCTRCIDACPTQALTPYKIDAGKCISYLTIELKGDIPGEFKGKYESWIFGCDICQEVCPWNRFSKPHDEPEFSPDPALESLGKKDWEEMTEGIFQKLFRKSPLNRAKFSGMKRNIHFARK